MASLYAPTTIAKTSLFSVFKHCNRILNKDFFQHFTDYYYCEKSVEYSQNLLGCIFSFLIILYLNETASGT